MNHTKIYDWSQENPQKFNPDNYVLYKDGSYFHKGDMPPAFSTDEASGRNPEDMVAELNADVAWRDITGNSDDPHVQRLTANAYLKPRERFTRREVAAYALRQMRLF